MVAGLCTEEAWGRMFDTVLHAKLADPQLAGSDADGLKELAADIVPGAVQPGRRQARAKLFRLRQVLKETDASLRWSARAGRRWTRAARR